MDLSLVAGAVAAVSWLMWLRLSARQRTVLPVLLLYGSSMSFGLQGLSQAFAVGGSALRGAGLAVMALELAKLVTASRRSGKVPKLTDSRVLLGAMGLGALITAHIVMRGRGSLPVSPWGLVFVLLTIVYWLSIAEEVRSTTQRDQRVPVLFALLPCVLFVLVLGVRLGVLVGNTGKFSLGEGGVGLLNLSTNETAAMAIAPLLWSTRLIDCERSAVVRLGYLSIGASAAVVLSSGSRIGIAVAVVVLAAFLVRATAGGWRARRVGMALALGVLVTAGAVVVRARTSKEVESFASGNAVSAQFAVPGGERAILWASYLASFLDAAREEPMRYVWGVGPAGISEAYANSALPALGITIDRASFYPVHSDVLELAMTGGLIGILCAVLLVRGIVSLPTSSGMSRQALGALFAFGALSAVDMLQYVPGVVALIFAAYAETVEVPGKVVRGVT